LTVAAQSDAIALTADRRWQDLHGLVLHNATIRVEAIR